jgi:hypothetical protein
VRGPDHLFVSWRGRITKQVVVLLCKRVSHRIGRRLHPHLFRHTFGYRRVDVDDSDARTSPLSGIISIPIE